MSEVNSIKQSATYVAFSEWFEGDPVVRVADDGQLAIQPSGRFGPYLSISPERWEQLATAVAVAQFAAKTGAVA